MADKRALDAEHRLDCDLLMLDFIIHNTIDNLLKVKRDSPDAPVVLSEDLRSDLVMVESLLTIFKATHDIPSVSLPNTVVIRLQLLRFVTCFVFLHQPTVSTPTASALASLRLENSTRALRWRERQGVYAFPEALYHAYHADDYKSVTANTIHGKIPETLTLLDLIPMFIQLTAAASSPAGPTTSWAPTTMWFSLAAEMMLRAALECYPTVVPPRPPFHLGPILEAFSWGAPKLPPPSHTGPAFLFTGTVPDSQDTTDHHDSLWTLASETTDSGTVWHKLRARNLGYFVPPRLTDDGTLEQVTKTTVSSVHKFETTMCLFLEALHKGLGRPMFEQMERHDEVVDRVKVKNEANGEKEGERDGDDMIMIGGNINGVIFGESEMEKKSTR